MLYNALTGPIFIRSHAAVWVFWTHNTKCAFREADNLSPHEQLARFSFTPPPRDIAELYTRRLMGKCLKRVCIIQLCDLRLNFIDSNYHATTHTHLQIKCSIILN